MATLTATKNYVSYCDALKGIVADIDARVFFKNGEVNAANEGWCDGIITSATLTASGGYAVVFEYDTANVPTSFVITFDSATSDGNSCDPESLAECSLMKKIDAMQTAQELAVNPPVQWGEIEGSLASQTDLVTVITAKAPTDSPNFIGNARAPTVAVGIHTTAIATTEFVNNAINEALGGTVVADEFLFATGSLSARVNASAVAMTDGVVADTIVDSLGVKATNLSTLNYAKLASDGLEFKEGSTHNWSPSLGISLQTGAKIQVAPYYDPDGVSSLSCTALAGRVKFPIGTTAREVQNFLCSTSSIAVCSISTQDTGVSIVARAIPLTQNLRITLHAAASVVTEVDWILLVP